MAFEICSWVMLLAFEVWSSGLLARSVVLAEVGARRRAATARRQERKDEERGPAILEELRQRIPSLDLCRRVVGFIQKRTSYRRVVAMLCYSADGGEQKSLFRISGWEFVC